MKLTHYATNGQNAIVVHDMITTNSAHQKPSNINSMLLARGETEKFNALIERKSKKLGLALELGLGQFSV